MRKQVKIVFTEAAKELSFHAFKEQFANLGEFAKLEGQEKEKALVSTWQDLTGKKIEKKTAAEKAE